MRKIVTGMALLAAALLSMPVAAEGVAVSSLNGKFSAEGGTASGQGAGLFSGSVAAPINKHYGVQGDATLGTLMGDFTGAVGGHVFRRDSENYLLGFEGGYATAGGADIARIGGEGEAYIGKLTFLGKAGYQFGDKGTALKFLDGFVGGLGAKYYATDNIALGGGASLTTGTVSGYGEVEYQPDLMGLHNLSVFGHGESDGSNKATVLAGLRYYFGDNKSLIKRHREDDPQVFLNGGSGNLAATIAKSRAEWLAVGAGTEPDSGNGCPPGKFYEPILKLCL